MSVLFSDFSQGHSDVFIILKAEWKINEKHGRGLAQIPSLCYTSGTGILWGPHWFVNLPV